jgi:ribonuclease D
VIESPDAARAVVTEIASEEILGFDIESKPAFKKGEFYPPSIVQLAGRSKVYIFKLAKIGGISSLIPIFENENIAKVGAAVNHDICNLCKMENFEPRTFHDLGVFSRKLKIAHTGLRNLAAIFLRVRISKRSQLTDWSQENLTPQQVLYAATDAWISREIFMKMARYF